jgi:hypothetical protein
MTTMKNFFKKFVNESFTGWGIFIIIITLISNVCFLLGAGQAICKSAPATEAYIFSAILALIGLNIAVTFFMPMLITKNQITDTVRDIVDQKFIKKNGTICYSNEYCRSLAEGVYFVILAKEVHLVIELRSECVK